MLIRENPYEFVDEDSKGKAELEKPRLKKPKKKGDDN